MHVQEFNGKKRELCENEYLVQNTKYTKSDDDKRHSFSNIQFKTLCLKLTAYLLIFYNDIKAVAVIRCIACPASKKSAGCCLKHTEFRF